MSLLEPYLRPRVAEALPGRPSLLRAIDVAPKGTSWGCLVAIAVALLAALALVVVGFVTVVRWLLRA